MLNKSKNVETFLGCDANYEDARIVLYGAPFDSTTSYRPGTRFASRMMRAESYGLETYSPYQDLDLEDAAVFDGGDLELCFGDTQKALDDIHDFAADILKDNKLPLLIGGEHLVSLPAIQAVYEKYPDLCVIHFDAHTDLRDDYLGAKLSHASVIRRVWDFVGDGRIWQFGIRSGERAEFYWAKEHTHLQKFNFDGLENAVAQLKGKPVYLTIDLDVLDPSCFPGTGTPEAGGVTFMQLFNAMLSIIQGCQVVGCDLVELSPMLDASGASTATALKVLREMLLGLEKPFIKPVQI
ncbi:agmatinase [Schwartzia succinivorans]|jgi:agmatinase|uniref:Agmatinase n=1 Tax=Schwartzia succinivorans DSM 10502 TaxID=1123243 RepID=A0A1M4VER6_9FIRM|nr:agmatinase [Schwartzia succinivorans]MBQ3863956.1 agmatinase [Schwartzia sp. (in: firmicutes)]SHE67425.1 agmatinase [Schwartzia succinivorans DSM 10502]